MAKFVIQVISSIAQALAESNKKRNEIASMLRAQNALKLFELRHKQDLTKSEMAELDAIQDWIYE